MQAQESVKEQFWPVIFVAVMAYITWYFPKYIISFGWASDALKVRYDTANLLDYLAFSVALVAMVMGVRTVRTSHSEHEIENWVDRISLFLSRVTMLLILLLVGVMFYEVVLRYIFERPTLWANELSLWIASFVFLLAGLYAMQQRSHIRIYLLYDTFPRWLQKTADVVSTGLIMVFTITMIWGAFNEAQAKFLRWETFGTAFDPPIPATLKPMVLIIILLVAIQAIANLVADWNKAPEHHAPVDESEIEDLVQELGERITETKNV